MCSDYGHISIVHCFDECQILGNMKKNPPSLMLFTVIKNLQGLGYLFKVIFCDIYLHSFEEINLFARMIYAVHDDNSRSIWEQLGGQISILSPEIYSHNDWTTFEGIIVDSLEAKEAILRTSVPNILWKKRGEAAGGKVLNLRTALKCLIM
ncbi:hypothetical protein CK203_048964 [Vitis vinifera]|uniref:Uncharacterized protein n=1 Tax=Vitis vinifera TaxID=29760 RepID=A0A438GVJ4_VITVI|nr:hypothetical protein CK203_048964 [Vitis vinifera]